MLEECHALPVVGFIPEGTSRVDPTGLRNGSFSHLSSRPPVLAILVDGLPSVLIEASHFGTTKNEWVSGGAQFGCANPQHPQKWQRLQPHFFLRRSKTHPAEYEPKVVFAHLSLWGHI